MLGHSATTEPAHRRADRRRRRLGRRTFTTPPLPELPPKPGLPPTWQAFYERFCSLCSLVSLFQARGIVCTLELVARSLSWDPPLHSAEVEGMTTVAPQLLRLHWAPANAPDATTAALLHHPQPIEAAAEVTPDNPEWAVMHLAFVDEGEASPRRAGARRRWLGRIFKAPPQESVDRIQARVQERNAAFLACLQQAWASHEQDPAGHPCLPWIPAGAPYVAAAAATAGEAIADPSPTMRSSCASSGDANILADPDIVPPSSARSTLEGLVQDLSRQSFHRGQLKSAGTWSILPARPAVYAEPVDMRPWLDQLSPPLRAYVTARQLYCHQSEALQALLPPNHGHALVATSTASGKSLIGHLTILHRLAEDPEARFLVLLPTKALAQDQLRAWLELLAQVEPLGYGPHVHVSCFDGDTPLAQRDSLRLNSQVILTNVDTLHASILPRHATVWRSFLAHLRMVVVDEVHYYLGDVWSSSAVAAEEGGDMDPASAAATVLGEHCAYVFRRLRRLTTHHGNPGFQLLGLSATLPPGGPLKEGGPVPLFRALCGIPLAEPVAHVHEDGSPAGPRLHLTWLPAPVVDPSALSDPGEGVASLPGLKNGGGGNSCLAEAIHLLTFLLQRGLRCICFARSRAACELVTRQLQAHLGRVLSLQHLASRVVSYRAGYFATTRRELEADMQAGRVVCIISTNALELGMDIGFLDAVVVLGTPRSEAALLQQIGRAGRRGCDAVSIVIPDSGTERARPGPTGPSTVHPPTFLAGGEPNEDILEWHLHCAASEVPLCWEEVHPFSGQSDTAWFPHPAATLCTQHLRHDSQTRTFYAGLQFRGRPHAARSLRGASHAVYRVLDATTYELVEELEEPRVPTSLYVGAMYLHRGHAYTITQVDAARKVAMARRCQDLHYLTRPRIEHIFQPQGVVASFNGLQYGPMRVEQRVIRFHKVHPLTGEVLDAVGMPVSLNATDCFVHTVHALWMSLSDSAVRRVASMPEEEGAAWGQGTGPASPITHLLAALGAWLVRVLHRRFGFTLCAVPSLGAVGLRTSPAGHPPRLVIYDATGAPWRVERSLEVARDALVRLRADLLACPCTSGCEGCMASQPLPGLPAEGLVKLRILAVLAGLGGGGARETGC